MNWWSSSTSYVKDRWAALQANKSPTAIAFKQVAIPALAALAYAIVAGVYPNQSKAVRESFTDFIVALFFIMWFVGLWERAKKRSTDDKAFSGIQGDLASLIAELRSAQKKQTTAPSVNYTEWKPSTHSIPQINEPTAPYLTPGKIDERETANAPPRKDQPPSIDSSFNALHDSPIKLRMEVAKNLAALGFEEASLLEAGVALEAAVKMFAKVSRIDVDERRTASLGQLVRQMRHSIPQDESEELEMLVRIRNEIAHGHGTKKLMADDVEYILETYERAIALLDRAAYRYQLESPA